MERRTIVRTHKHLVNDVEFLAISSANARKWHT
jgi:hypothetical protein